MSVGRGRFEAFECFAVKKGDQHDVFDALFLQKHCQKGLVVAETEGLVQCVDLVVSVRKSLSQQFLRITRGKSAEDTL